MTRLLLALLLIVPASAASLDGRKINYTDTHKGRKTVVLVHGWTCDETSWRPQVDALRAKYRVIAIDLPGHGKSEMPAGEFTQALFARSIATVLDEAKVKRAVLVGHSMGGFVIWRFAQLYPQRIVALVEVDAPLSAVGRLEALTQLAPSFSGEKGKATRESMITGMFSPAATPQVRKQVLDMMLAAPEATAVGAFKSMADPAFAPGSTLDVPVLAIGAPRGGMATEEPVKKIFPKAEYHRMENTGHFVMLEKPDEFNRMLIDFLTRVRF